MKRFEDLESEKGLIGTLIINPFNHIEIVDMVKPEMFTSHLCRASLNVLNHFHEENIEADTVVLYDALKERNHNFSFDEVSDLVNYMNSDNLIQYAANIKEAYFNRMMTGHLNESLRLISSGAKVIEVVNSFDSNKELLIDNMQTGRNDHVSAFAKDSLDMILNAKNSEKGLSGITSGSENIDYHFGGFQRGRTMTIAGRPGIGKTSLTLGWLLEAAKSGTPALVFSLEVSREMVIMMLVSNITGVPTDVMLRGDINDEQEAQIIEAHSTVSELPIYVIDGVYGIDEIVSKSRLYSKKFGVEIMMVDYIQLAKGTKEKRGNRHQEIESIMGGLKKLTKKTDAYLCVMNLSQLSRAVETRGGSKRPQLSDLKESGSIEEGSDIVFFVYRPEYYGILEDENGESLKGIVEIIIAKNKWGGCGTIKQKIVNRRAYDIADTDFDEMEDFTPVQFLKEQQTREKEAADIFGETPNVMKAARPSESEIMY